MDEDNLISKKDVLAITGISYGQFYRWKRKGLIPESWFIRKSTFTGQETFLPRDKVLARIEKIQSLKDEHSLEELAQVLAPEVRGRDFTVEEAGALGWILPETRAFCEPFRGRTGAYRFHEILFLTVLERLRHDLDDQELGLVAATLFGHEQLLQEGDDFRWWLSVGRKPFERPLSKAVQPRAVSVCLLHDGRCLLDGGATLAAQIDLHAVLEDLKLKLSGLQ